MSRPKVEAWRRELKKVEGREALLALALVERFLGREKALSDYPKIEAAFEAAEIIKAKPKKEKAPKLPKPPKEPKVKKTRVKRKTAVG